MSAKKLTLSTTAIAILTCVGPANAHPLGHEEFSFAELVEHVTTDPFHVGAIVIAAVAIVAILRLRKRQGRRDNDKSGSANE